MKRITASPGRVATDLYGTGKDGFTNGNPLLNPAALSSPIESDMANTWTEELARVVESEGSELDEDDLHQVARTIFGAQERYAVANMIGTGGAAIYHNQVIRHGRATFDPDAGRFLRGTNTGKVATTSDGIDWVDSDWGSLDPIEAVAWHPIVTRWIASGAGKISISTDGVNWVQQVNPSGIEALDADYGSGNVVLVGADGGIATSATGINMDGAELGNYRNSSRSNFQRCCQSVDRRR